MSPKFNVDKIQVYDPNIKGIIVDGKQYEMGAKYLHKLVHPKSRMRRPCPSCYAHLNTILDIFGNAY